MAITNACEIKPQHHMKNRVSKILSKNSLRHLENRIKSYVSRVLCGSSWVQDIANTTEEKAELLQVAPVECSRFPSAIGMSCVESLKATFWPLNGYSTQSKLFISLDTETLRKAFSIYGSGAFRRDEIREKYPQLETLIHGSYIPDQAGVECELKWYEVDEVPQMKLLLCTGYAGEKTKWISNELAKDINQLIQEMNENIMTTARKAQ